MGRFFRRLKNLLTKSEFALKEPSSEMAGRPSFLRLTEGKHLLESPLQAVMPIATKNRLLIWSLQSSAPVTGVSQHRQTSGMNVVQLGAVELVQNHR